MKAYVVRGVGNFGMEEVPTPTPKEKEVLLAVKAVGICGSDIPRIYHAGSNSHSLIPGHEFAGKVIEVGEGVDKNWIGRRVGAFPLLPCFRCKSCKKKLYEMCSNYSYIGSRRDGAFAECVCVPEWNLFLLPPNVSYLQAAMLEPMAVAVHAMQRVELKCESSVAIWGLGTIGLALLMFLRERGIKNILVLGNKNIQKKNAFALGIGEDSYFDICTGSPEDWLESKKAEQEIEVFFDCVGTNEVMTQVIRNIAPAGKVILVGNPPSDMSFDRQTYWKILRNQLTIIGTWNSSFNHKEWDDWHYVMEKLQQGKIQPEKFITHRFGFDEFIQGFHIMRDKKDEYIKLISCLESGRTNENQA